MNRKERRLKKKKINMKEENLKRSKKEEGNIIEQKGKLENRKSKKRREKYE